MRVLHIITGLGYGGAERQLHLLLRHLPAHCEVAALTHPGAVAGALRADGFRVHEIGMRGNRDLAALPRLVRLIRDGRYDVVHTHLYRACVFGRIAARLAGVRAVVATEHSLGDRLIEGRTISAGVRALYRATERLGAATVAVSPTVAHRLGAWGVPAARVATIPNAVDAAAFAFDAGRRAAARRRLGIEPGAYVVGAMGRLVGSKRFDLLIAAFAGLPEGVLLIVGDGPLRPELRRLAGERGMADRVIFAGERDDAPAMLAAMDLFAAPSAEETFGLAVLEALAAGLPALYAACPALTDPPAGAADAPGARRVAPEAAAWRAAIAARMREGPVRLPPPAALRHYDVARSSAELAHLYHRTSTSTTSRKSTKSRKSGKGSR